MREIHKENSFVKETYEYNFLADYKKIIINKTHKTQKWYHDIYSQIYEVITLQIKNILFKNIVESCFPLTRKNRIKIMGTILWTRSCRLPVIDKVINEKIGNACMKTYEEWQTHLRFWKINQAGGKEDNLRLHQNKQGQLEMEKTILEEEIHERNNGEWVVIKIKWDMLHKTTANWLCCLQV